MIAKIFPIRRLPAHAGPYDYIASDETRPGDLVEITFKGQAMYGIVWALEDRSDLIRIEKVGHRIEKSFLDEEDRRRFDAMALITAQSVASYLTLLPITQTKGSVKRWIRKESSIGTYTKEEIAYAKSRRNEPYTQDTAHQWPLHILFRIQEIGQHLIICPNEEIASYLCQALGKKGEIALARGGMRSEEERNLFNEWRAGRQRILITTRHATLWPARHLASIVIVDEANPDYDFRPRNPRYDARFTGHLLAKQHHASIYRIGHATNLDISEKRALIEKSGAASLDIIDAAKHPIKAPHLSLPIIEALEKAFAKQQKVIIFLNKKGVATHFQCRACGHLPTCGNCGAIPLVRLDDLICPSCHTEMWHPEKCPNCSKKTLTKKGIGIEHVQKSLEEHFPHEKIGERIILLSEIGLRSLELNQTKNIGLIIDLCADYHFLDDSYACEEKGRYKLMRLLDLAKDNHAQTIIQTYQPERIQSLLAIDWQEKELKIRKKHKLPPYSIEIIIQPKDGKKEILRPVDKDLLLQYLVAFRSLGRKDTINIHPQIAAYERITPSE